MPKRRRQRFIRAAASILMQEIRIEARRADPRDSELARAWRGVQVLAPASPFQRWNWISSWLEGVPESIRPLALTFRDANEVVGLALVGRGRVLKHRILPTRYLVLSTAADPRHDWITVEHNDVLALPGKTKEIRIALCDWMISQAEIDEYRFPGLSDGNFADAIAAASARVGYQLRDYESSPFFVADLASVRRTKKSYLETLSSNTRYQLKKAMRAATGQGNALVEVAKSPTQVEEFFADLVRFHQQYWQEKGKPGAFGRDTARAFHSRYLSIASAAGEVELLRISTGGTILGYLYNLISGRRVYSYQSGFNYAVPHLKPGMLSHAFAIDRYVEADMDAYDFLEGDAQYKRSMSHESGTMRWVVVNRPTARYQLEGMARRGKELFKKLRDSRR